MKNQIIRPLDHDRPHLQPFQRTGHRHRAGKGDKRCIFWTEAWSEQKRMPESNAGTGYPRAPKSSAACCLLFTKCQTAIGCTGNCHLLDLAIGGIQRQCIAYFSFPEFFRCQTVCPENRINPVPCIQPVSPFASAFNLPALTSELFDLFPYSSSCHPQLPAHFLARDIFTAAKHLQDALHIFTLR